MCVISLTNVLGGSNNEIFNQFQVNSSSEMKNATSGKYFRELLKKVSNSSSSESSGNKIMSEQELIAVYCDIQETYNNSNDGSLDKKHKILMGEMRKLNIKLIKLDNKLDAFMSEMEKLLKTEMKSLKDEISSLKSNERISS